MADRPLYGTGVDQGVFLDESDACITAIFLLPVSPEVTSVTVVGHICTSDARPSLVDQLRAI